MIRAVTVDFWGTLILEGPHTDDLYRDRRLADFATILGAAGLPVAPRMLGRGYEASARELAWLWAEGRDVPVQRHVTSLLEGAEAGLSVRVSAATLEALVEAYSRPALRVLPPAAEGALAGLMGLVARGLTLAVVSNTMRTPGATLRKVLAAHGLLDPFAYLTFSDEVGVRKPAREIFLLTLERLGVGPEESVHVGDDDVLDVAGARGAGLRAIQVRRPGQPAGAHVPDVAIESLAGLPDAVEQLERRA